MIGSMKSLTNLRKDTRKTNHPSPGGFLMEKSMKVNVLGRAYELLEVSTETDPALKENDGYCDPSVAVCVVDKLY